MIIKLQPEDISKYWDAIKDAYLKVNRIKEEEKQKAGNHLLAELLSGRFQCWLGFERDENDEAKIHAMVITAISKDIFSGRGELLIGTLFGYRLIPDEIWTDGFEKLKMFAKSNNCSSIIAYTDVKNKRVREIAEKVDMREEQIVIKCFV